jgi:hypothetical protein
MVGCQSSTFSDPTPAISCLSGHLIVAGARLLHHLNATMPAWAVIIASVWVNGLSDLFISEITGRIRGPDIIGDRFGSDAEIPTAHIEPIAG